MIHCNNQSLMYYKILPYIEFSTDRDPTFGSSPTTPRQSTTDGERLLTRNEIIFTAAVGTTIILIGAAVIATILFYCRLKMSRDKKLRSKSSIHGVSHRVRRNSYTTGVYLKSHKAYKTSIKENRNTFQLDGHPPEDVVCNEMAEMKFE